MHEMKKEETKTKSFICSEYWLERKGLEEAVKTKSLRLAVMLLSID